MRWCLLLLFLLASCSYTPWGYDSGLVDRAPPGTPLFRQAWKDGCASGFSASGSMVYKMNYTYVFDGQYVTNDEYYDAWRMGFNHCRWYVSIWSAQQ